MNQTSPISCSRTTGVSRRLTVLAVLALVFALALCAGCSNASTSDASSSSEEASDSSFAAEINDNPDPSAQPDASNAEDGENGDQAGDDEASSASSATTSADLSARDADFAGDPDRKTDWNFEGNGKKVVYLTIDDGPSANTQAVLDILDKYNCKATFFVIGLDSDYFPMIKEAYDRGHTIGLHSYTHDYATVYSSVDAYYADLDAIGEVVKEQIGYVPCFIRFPGGSSNEISADYSQGIMSELVNSVQERGYQYYDWNMSIGDGAEHTTDELVGYATEPTELTNIMLLCHDSGTKQTTVEALPKIIEHYQALGYSFEAIDRSTFVAHHGVSN